MTASHANAFAGEAPTLRLEGAAAQQRLRHWVAPKAAKAAPAPEMGGNHGNDRDVCYAERGDREGSAPSAVL